MKSRKYKPPKRYRKRFSFKTSKWGPHIQLGIVVLCVVLLLLFIVYVALPKLLPLIGVDYHAPFVPTPTPAPTAPPTPTPHPMAYFNINEEQQEVMFSDYTSYRWFADPYFYNDKLIFAAGRLIGTDVEMQKLIMYEPDTRVGETLSYAAVNDHLLFPRFNSEWLVYFDAHKNGGGNIMACSMKNGYGEAVLIKEVFTGQPELMLDGKYLAWIERTGSRMDKLFVCDLESRETAVVQMFSNSIYGQSLPSLRDGLLVWADAGDVVDGEEVNSTIYSIAMTQSTVSTFKAPGYVHDPECVDGNWAWLDAHHSEDTKLYYMHSGTQAKVIAEGVVEFGMEADFLAYTKDEALWVYIFETDETYRVTPEHEKAQFLGVSDNKVIWMDVTSRERDIMKFVEIP
ncbi:MAG: hypothetical protein IJO48_04910 [Clostridia bacterium]|nr:hypothetical protein [Clostridia bacterium]